MNNKLKQAVRWTLILLGILLAINGVVMTAVSNFTTGIVALWLLAMLLAGVGLWWDAIQKMTGHGVMRAVKYAVLAGVLFTLGLCIFIGIYGQMDTVDQTEDVILVLGCGVKGSVPTRPLVERLETAIQAYHSNPDAYILVSGGQGPRRTPTKPTQWKTICSKRESTLKKLSRKAILQVQVKIINIQKRYSTNVFPPIRL